MENILTKSFLLKNDLTFIIVAYNNTMPETPDAVIQKHTVRGLTTINLLKTDAPPEPNIAKEISMSLEFRVDNVTTC